MSHFSVLVLTDECKPGDSRLAIDVAVEELLEQYSENLVVPKYSRECWCINNVATTRALKEAEEELGVTVEEKRKEFHEMENPPTWGEHMADLFNRRDELIETYDDKDKPDPGCYTCKGKGRYMSNYNPKSKWDWYVMGGRWTGMLVPDYDPTKDERNIKECYLCKGTGDREGWVTYEETKDKDGNPMVERVFTDDWAKEMNGCNGCHGTGKSIAFSLAPFEGDIQTVKYVLDTWNKQYVPFAVVDTVGDWYEKAEMGWWGMTLTEPKDGWEEEVKAILERNKEATAIVIDCHI